MKRIFDIVIGSLVMLVLSPLIMLIAVAIRMETPGRVVFRQRRAGWRGKPFVMLKFRTMRTDVDPYDSSPHSADDPRLTKVGRWIREKSLDEIPQLWNVIAGQMSLVGPRPLYERQAALWDERQRRRVDVKPGITGYAQVYGRADLTHEEKIELDLEYVKKHGFALDLELILKTLSGIFRRGGEIYERRYSRDKERESD